MKRRRFSRRSCFLITGILILIFLIVGLGIAAAIRRSGRQVTLFPGLPRAEDKEQVEDIEIEQSETEPFTEPTEPRTRPITANIFSPEQLNSIDTLVIQVNFTGQPDPAFNVADHWDKIFGKDDPLHTLNGYYRENFYNQLELKALDPVPDDNQPHLTVEFPGTPADYPLGFLIGLEDPEVASVDPEVLNKIILDTITKTAEKYPQVNFQDKFIFTVLNAQGFEYGRGAIGALPGGGVEPVYDLFVGSSVDGSPDQYTDQNYFRQTTDNRLVGLIKKNAYDFPRYFEDRGQQNYDDQFIRGMAIFAKDAPLSCASHDIVHGLKRKSAYAEPQEGRERALNCLYNLPEQSKWLVGTPETGYFDRGVNATPYIGWWDPMGDHLHPAFPRDFFDGIPNGMTAFSKLALDLIPDRSQTIINENSASVNLGVLGNPDLPNPGVPHEKLAVKIPLDPTNSRTDHIYLLLEYRRRVGAEVGQLHPDNFSITPESIVGQPWSDPGYNSADPAASSYINPPTRFTPDEGVLVYIVNEEMPEIPSIPYTDWYKYRLALLNPAGNDQRDDLNQAALDTGQSLTVDFRDLYEHAGVPITIDISVESRGLDYAVVNIRRNYLD